jgi:iron complex outermembrane receptor protein/vitamin B12 transporter
MTRGAVTSIARDVIRNRHILKRSLTTRSMIAGVLIILGTSLFANAALADDRAATVAGRVLDPLGGAIAHAKVTLIRDQQAVTDATTDESGRFAVSANESGRYQVRVEAPGFQSRDTDPIFVAVGDRVALDITLPIGTLAQQVVVSATATILPESQVGASVTVLDQSVLESLGKPDVLEALRLVPGAQVVQTGQRGGTTSLFVRGGNANFNKVIIDGVPVNDIGGSFDFANLPVTGLERVEVLRNPNSVLYGADALASVVNITTRRGTSRVPELSYAVDGGNLGTMRQDVSIGGAKGRFDYFSAFSHFDTQNNVPNDAYHNGTYAGTFGWTINPSTRFAVTGRHTATAQGAPNAFDFYGIADDSSQTNRNTYIGAVLQLQTTSRWAQTVRFTSTDLRYHYVNPTPTGDPFDPFGSGPNYLGETVTIHGANGTSATGRAILDFAGAYPQSFDSGTTRRALIAQTDYALSDHLSLSGGFRFEDETGFTDSGTRTTTTRHNGGAFVEARRSFGERVYVAGGVGLDHNAVFGFAPTPRVSVATYLRRPSDRETFGDTKLVFNAGTGIKAPSISQQASSLFGLLRSTSPGAALISTFGVSPIGPERSRGLDLGVEQGLWHQRARARVTVFDNHYDDLIEFLSKTALTLFGVPGDVAAVAAATSFGAYVNSSSYYARGVEMAVDSKVASHLIVSGAYSYLDAVVTHSFASSALRPAFNPAYPGVAIGASGPLVGGRPFRRAPNTASLHAAVVGSRGQVSVAGYFVGRQDASTSLTDAFGGKSLLLPNHDLAPGYQKVDLSGEYRLHSWIRLYAVVENVLNQHYEAPLGYPALPVTARTGVALTLGGPRGSRE